MLVQEIQFQGNKSLCVFPEDRSQLSHALTCLKLADGRPVIVLVGGYIPDENAEATQKAVDVIAAYADEHKVLIICGGTVVGIMGSIGSTRLAHKYQFDLLGVTLKNLASWPKGPQSRRILWWGRQRWSLSAGYTHFLLVPGEQFGEDSSWIVDAASCVSQGNRSVTILANGGGVARKDIDLSLAGSRPVIVLAGTGRLADELASRPDASSMLSIVQADRPDELVKAIQKHL